MAVKREIKVGIFVLVGFIVAGLIIFLVGDERRVFDKHSSLHTTFENVTGLKPGAPVRMGGVDVGTVSVNLSAAQLPDPGLLHALRTSLAHHGVPPALLELELTESTLMANADDRMAQLHALKDIGLKLSIDDFGTGFSNLSYLARLPADVRVTAGEKNYRGKH